MEFRGVYLVWLLLPLICLMLCVWVYARPIFKVTKCRESLNTYWSPFVFTTGCLLLSILIDQFGVMEALKNLLVTFALVDSGFQVGVFRFILYPAVMVAAANVQRVVYREDEERRIGIARAKWTQ